MTEPEKKPDDSDWGTHIQNPNDVWKNESPREKFDDWLKLWHFVVYFWLFVVFVVGAIWASCKHK